MTQEMVEGADQSAYSLMVNDYCFEVEGEGLVLVFSSVQSQLPGVDLTWSVFASTEIAL